MSELDPNLAQSSSPGNIASGVNPEMSMNPEALFSTRSLVDQAGFTRTQFDIADTSGNSTLAVEFRAREELPITKADEALHVVVSDDVKPEHTKLDEYGSWVQDRTGGENYDGVVLGMPSADNVERQSDRIYSSAIEGGKERVVLHAPATAEGVIDVAIQVALHGGGDAKRTSQLVELRRTLVDSPTPELTDRIMKLALSMPNPEEGFMLAALDLAGVTEAQDQASELVRSFDRRNAVHNLGEVTVERIGADAYAQPGETIPADTIDEVRKAGLVVVHTTQTYPENGEIVSTSGHTDGSVPRDTVHFSMNHAVSSHMGGPGSSGGNFAARPFTIVASMAGMLEQNGAPVRMADVDTFFLADSNNAVKIPEDTVIIEVARKTGAKQGIVQTDGRWLLDVDMLASAEGVSQIAEELQELSELPGYRRSDAVSALANALTQHGDIDLALSIHNTKNQVLYGLGAQFEGQDNDTPEWAALRDQAKQTETDMVAIESMFPQGTKLDGGALSQLLGNSDVLSTNATLAALLQEATRKVMVALAIAKSGGKDFPKGGSHYTTGYGNFQAINNRLADMIGVPTGLHAHSADARIEQELGAIKQQVETRMVLPDGSTTRIGFDWTKINSGGLRYNLGNASAPQRYKAMKTGLLTFTSKAQVEASTRDNVPYSVYG